MENISQMSLLEVALKIMEEKGGVVNIYDLIAEVLAAKGIADEDNTYATQLYVDITTSSKFVYMGEDNWDLKSRQSLDQFDKDGAFFNPKGSEGDYEEDEDDDLDDDEDEDNDLDDDEDDEDREDDDEDEEDEDRDEDDESMYDEESEEDEESDEDDNSIDEDKYNEYMDDYEDLYEA